MSEMSESYWRNEIDLSIVSSPNAAKAVYKYWNKLVHTKPWLVYLLRSSFLILKMDYEMCEGTFIMHWFCLNSFCYSLFII